MSFKEQLEKDLTMFINPDELAEMIDINGIQVVGVFEAEEVQEIKRDQFAGTNKNSFKLYLKTNDAEAIRFTVNSQIYINKNPYFIEYSGDNKGVTEVRLTQMIGRY